MPQKISRKKELEEISSSKKWEGLNQFDNPVLWKSMSKSDQDLLARLFIQQGESQLKIGDAKAIKSFRTARKVSPGNNKLLLRQAQVFAGQESNPRCLEEALKCLQMATKANGDSFQVWSLWGTVHLRLGMLLQDSSHFSNAVERFDEAERLKAKASSSQLAEMYWGMGISWYSLGKESGEQMEFHRALNTFKEAKSHGADHPAFWNNYGNALVEIGYLQDGIDSIFDGIELYRRALKKDPNFFSCYLNLACALFHIFQKGGGDEHFDACNNAFERAAAIDDSNSLLWMKWGDLLLVQGKALRDTALFEKARDAYEKADKLEKNHPVLMSGIGECLLFQGHLEESLPKMKDAELIFQRVLEIDAAHPWYWYLMGLSLQFQGEYFSEDIYFEKAAQCFHKGLEIDPEEPFIWHGLGQSYFYLSGSGRESKALLEAIRCFERVIECRKDIPQSLLSDLGIALIALSEITGDKQYVEKALRTLEQKLFPNGKDLDEENLDLGCLFNYGCCWDLLGDASDDIACYEKAIEALSKALEIAPSALHILHYLAITWTHLGEATGEIECFHKAHEYFETLVQLDPEDDQIWNDWGTALLNLAHLLDDPIVPQHSEAIYHDAESKFLSAIGLGNEQAYYHLACLYSLTGNTLAAFYFLEKAHQAAILPPMDDLLFDDWLENLRNTEEFEGFLQHLLNEGQPGVN